MTRPVETQRSSGSSQPSVGPLVADVRSFLEVWQELFTRPAAWVPAQIEVLRQQSQALHARAREAATDGLAQHLLSCVQCLGETPLDRAKLGRCLRNVSELAWRLRQQTDASSARARPARTELVAPIPEVRRVASASGASADEPPSLEALLELGCASLVEQSQAPGSEPVPGIAEIEGFPISERPPALNELLAGGQLLAPPRPEPASPHVGAIHAPRTRTAPFPAPLWADPEEPGRTTAPFPAPVRTNPEGRRTTAPFPAPVWVHPGGPGRATAPFPAPMWTTPPVSGIRWGLVLLIVGVLGGIGALLIGLEVLRRQPVATNQGAAELEQNGDNSRVPNGHGIDGSGFDALRSQVHAYGQFESPELAALLDAEAGLVRSASTMACPAGAIGCRLDKTNGETSTFRRLGTSPPSGGGTLGPWLVNLRLPGIGVANDPRVRALFEFHTEHAVGREIFQGTLFQCGAYQSLIQEALIRHDVPLDLVALAMAASGCGADVESSTGARGLWQVSPVTARAYHLRVIPGVIDERLDPMKSTEAAVSVLADLRRKAGSWELAAASFGIGPFELLARLVRAGGQVDFYRLADADPLLAETAAFVSKVQAYALILANLDRFHFQDPPPWTPEETAALEVPPGTRLGLVARAARTSMTRVRELNPALLGSSVPAEPGGSFVLRVPGASGDRARERLPELIADADGAEQCVPHGFDWGRQRFTRSMAYHCREAGL